MDIYRDNAAICWPHTVDPDRLVDLLTAAQALVPAWAGAQNAATKEISGGITNRLVLLRAPGRSPLLFRFYGPNTDVVIDRGAENRLFARLSRLGFAPTYYGRFENGRIEQWLDGVRPLAPQELGQPEIRRGIARRLRQMHSFPAAETSPALWTTLEGWMERALALSFDGADGERYAALGLPRYAVRLGELHRDLEEHPPPSPLALRLVLAHNDLLSGNVLISDKTGELRFIDYEYGACNFAAFDIANHFCEYAGFDSDFAQGFPSRAVRDDFITAYLGGDGDVAAFSDAVDRFILPDHLWWGTWAVIQARHSPIAFDFMDYARLRFAGFDLHEPEFAVRRG